MVKAESDQSRCDVLTHKLPSLITFRSDWDGPDRESVLPITHPYMPHLKREIAVPKLGRPSSPSVHKKDLFFTVNRPVSLWFLAVRPTAPSHYITR
ncbi:hypothetical protein BaRGS_00035094 [Batillaria attramentaria]|uniref:Uncharacterized protein n=1 Tax=Batillaria attramentaria TaxID=370345 RepID=A0ABD0JFP2_9CAEN